MSPCLQTRAQAAYSKVCFNFILHFKSASFVTFNLREGRSCPVAQLCLRFSERCKVGCTWLCSCSEKLVPNRKENSMTLALRTRRSNWGKVWTQSAKDTNQLHKILRLYRFLDCRWQLRRVLSCQHIPIWSESLRIQRNGNRQHHSLLLCWLDRKTLCKVWPWPQNAIMFHKMRQNATRTKTICPCFACQRSCQSKCLCLETWTLKFQLWSARCSTPGRQRGHKQRFKIKWRNGFFFSPCKLLFTRPLKCVRDRSSVSELRKQSQTRSMRLAMWGGKWDDKRL